MSNASHLSLTLILGSAVRGWKTHFLRRPELVHCSASSGAISSGRNCFKYWPFIHSWQVRTHLSCHADVNTYCIPSSALLTASCVKTVISAWTLQSFESACGGEKQRHHAVRQRALPAWPCQKLPHSCVSCPGRTCLSAHVWCTSPAPSRHSTPAGWGSSPWHQAGSPVRGSPQLMWRRAASTTSTCRLLGSGWRVQNWASASQRRCRWAPAKTLYFRVSRQQQRRRLAIKAPTSAMQYLAISWGNNIASLQETAKLSSICNSSLFPCKQAAAYQTGNSWQMPRNQRAQAEGLSSPKQAGRHSVRGNTSLGSLGGGQTWRSVLGRCSSARMTCVIFIRASSAATQKL